MNSNDYLVNRMTEMIGPCKTHKHLHAYNFKRMQRFFVHTMAAFFVQYLSIIYLSWTYPALPMYPPIGTAFIMLYLLGNNVLCGLVLGGFCAYLAHGMAIPSIFLYLLADIGCAYLGGRLCQAVFSSDIAVLISTREWFKFIKISALTTCLLSSLLRLTAIVVGYQGRMQPTTILYNWVDLWLSDLSSILVFSGFFFSWISVYLGRAKLTYAGINKRNVFILIMGIIFCIASVKKIEWIIIAMAIALYLSRYYGFLIATALSYVVTMVFLAYLILHQQQDLHDLSVKAYTGLPVTLFFFVAAMLYSGLKSKRGVNAMNPPQRQ